MLTLTLFRAHGPPIFCCATCGAPLQLSCDYCGTSYDCSGSYYVCDFCETPKNQYCPRCRAPQTLCNIPYLIIEE